MSNRLSRQPEATLGVQSGTDPGAEQLSAWMDGELSAHDSTHFVVHFLQSPQRQQQWQEWTFIGDALRSHDTAACHSPRLCRHIQHALVTEPVLLAPGALQRLWAQHHRLARPLGTGVAIAAAAAMVMWVALPQWRSGLVPLPIPAAPLQASVNVVNTQPGLTASTVTAQTLAANNRPDVSLAAYMQAHHELAGGGVMPAAAEVYLPYRDEGTR